MYEDHLKRARALTIDVSTHAPPPSAATDQYRANLAGLLAIAYAAAFECSVKEIVQDFANGKHKILGFIVNKRLKKLNAGIKIAQLQENLLADFGEEYVKKFKKLIAEDAKKNPGLADSYDNYLIWRHKFAHTGEALASLEETIENFDQACLVIKLLDEALSL